MNQVINRKARTCLLSTRERLTTKGWTKGVVGESEGPNCLMGAMGFSFEDESWAQDYTVNIMRDILLGDAIVLFNDAPSTTFEDVLELIDNTILYLEEEDRDND